MRTSLLRLSALAAVGSAIAACASGSATSSSSSSPGPAVSQASGAAARPLVASLQPTNNAGNRIVGTVKLTPNGNQYRAEIQIRNGGGPQNKFPWAIRPGSCGDDSRDVLGNELAYRMLETSGDGSAHLVTPLRLTIPPGTFHVNVMKGVSSMDRETVVSCGVLSAS